MSSSEFSRITDAVHRSTFTVDATKQSVTSQSDADAFRALDMRAIANRQHKWEGEDE